MPSAALVSGRIRRPLSSFEFTEHQIQDQIIQLLGMRGYYVQRMNSGAMFTGEGRNRRMVRMNKAGTPDIMAFAPKHFSVNKEWAPVELVDLLFIEVKRPGKKPTELQRMKMEELESFGARCIVAHSVEEMEAAL